MFLIHILRRQSYFTENDTILVYSTYYSPVEIFGRGPALPQWATGDTPMREKGTPLTHRDLNNHHSLDPAVFFLQVLSTGQNHRLLHSLTT